MNIKGLIGELSGPRPLHWVTGSVNLGYWHPSMIFRDVSSLTDSRPFIAISALILILFELRQTFNPFPTPDMI